MDVLFEILGSSNFWAAAIRIATPLIFGVLGALICERAGVLNLGIEGIQCQQRRALGIRCKERCQPAIRVVAADFLGAVIVERIGHLGTTRSGMVACRYHESW